MDLVTGSYWRWWNVWIRYLREMLTDNSPGPNDKARSLLMRWLTPEQAAEFKEHKYFHVIGSDSGRRYRIELAQSWGIVPLDKHGTIVDKLCFVPVGCLPILDNMLAQKIAIETDEVRSLSISNSYAKMYGGRPAH